MVVVGPCYFNAFRYIDCHIPNRTQPGHCTRATHHHRTGDSRMVSRLVVIVHVLKVQNAPRPVRFSRVNTHLGASSCHQHGECVPPRRLELRRRPVVQVHITILVVRLGNATFRDHPLTSMSGCHQSMLSQNPPEGGSPTHQQSCGALASWPTDA